MIIAKPLFALLAVVASTDAEECGSIPEAGLCSATADILLLVDNSYSIADRALAYSCLCTATRTPTRHLVRAGHPDVTAFMSAFVHSFELSASALSPKIGLVSFSGCVGCSQAASASTLYMPSFNAAALLHAIDNRPPPDPDMPMTCISCALNLAQASSARS